jgi:hypothetical protein
MPGCHVACLDGLRSRGNGSFCLPFHVSDTMPHPSYHIARPSQCHAREDSFFSIIPFAVVAVALTRALPVLAGSLDFLSQRLVFLDVFSGVFVAFGGGECVNVCLRMWRRHVLDFGIVGHRIGFVYEVSVVRRLRW